MSFQKKTELHWLLSEQILSYYLDMFFPSYLKFIFHKKLKKKKPQLLSKQLDVIKGEKCFLKLSSYQCDNFYRQKMTLNCWAISDKILCLKCVSEQQCANIRFNFFYEMDAEDFELACIHCSVSRKTFIIQRLVFFTASAEVSSSLKLSLSVFPMFRIYFHLIIL